MLILSPASFEKLSPYLSSGDVYTRLSDGSFAVAVVFPLDEKMHEFNSFITAEKPPMMAKPYEFYRNAVGEDSYYLFIDLDGLRVGLGYNRLQGNAIVYDETLEMQPISCHIRCAVVPLTLLAFRNWQARTAKGATHHERRASPWTQ